MEWLWLLMVYGLAQGFEWIFGTGKSKGLNWFVRVGLDFCRMGVVLFGLLCFHLISGDSHCVRFEEFLINLNLSNVRARVIVVLIFFIVFLWGLAFKLDKIQTKARKKEMIARALCGSTINAIGVFLFITPIHFLS